MQNHRDPVDDALASLGGRSWPQDDDNIQLKDRIMNEAQTKRSGSLLRRRPTLAAALGLAVLGSAGFAAAGGIEMVKGWVFTVELEGVDGSVTVDLEKIDIQTDGNTTTLTIDTADLEIDGDVKDGATVTITATSDGGTIKTLTDADGNVIKTTALKGGGNDDQ